ncbi:MAG: hypothetical protein PHO58_05485, partial [Bacilli bacterium]|nr:hypothetical protein [Bacilli bacterium]
MKENLKKVVLIIIGFFLTSLFVSQNVFAEAGDKGIIIESFEYNQNGELTLSWSVDDGYENIFYNYYNKDLVKLYIMDDPYETIGLLDTGYGWGFVSFYTSLLDCLEPYNESLNFQEISVGDFGSKTCSMKFYKMHREYGGELYPSTGSYITKTDIDNAFYTDFLESISISFRSGPWNFSDTYGGGTYSFESESEPVMILTYSNDFPIVGTPISVNGVCGSVNGSTFDWADFDNQEFCSTGEFYYTGTEYNGTMQYACLGTGGGSDDYCSASYYINGECGTANGGYFSTSPETSTLCSA